MEIINNLLKNLADPNDSVFDAVFENFKSAIKKLEQDYAKSILNVAKKRALLHSNIDRDISPPLLINVPIGHITMEPIAVDIELKRFYTETNFTVAVRCDQIIRFCESYFDRPINETDQIKWNGEVKRFAAIIFSLIENKYIEAKRNSDENINFSHLSKLLLKHFKFDKTPDQNYFSKILNPESEPFDDKFYKKIKIVSADIRA